MKKAYPSDLPPILEATLWLDFNLVLLRRGESVDRAAMFSDDAICEYKKRFCPPPDSEG